MDESKTYSHWSDAAFAVLWIGALSVYWIHIKMSVRLQSLLGLGGELRFPISLMYVAAIYIFAVSLILWTGLGIYLAITGGLKPRRLLRGLSVILLVVVPTQVAGIFLKGLPLPSVVEYMTLWLPLFLGLWLSMWVGQPKGQRDASVRSSD